MDLTGLSREAVEAYAHHIEAEVERLRSVLEGLGGEFAELAEPEEPSGR